jgi:hypothetical protein
VNDREPGPSQACALGPGRLVASGHGGVCPWMLRKIPPSLSKPWERVFSDIKPENILGGSHPSKSFGAGCRRLYARTPWQRKERVQEAINALFSVRATFRNIRQCQLESQCNQCKTSQRFYFLQRQRCVIFRDTWQSRLATKCDQRQSGEGSVRDSIMREWNIKDRDSLRLFFRLNFHCLRHLVRDAFLSR